jgi:hypothetical protein
MPLDEWAQDAVPSISRCNEGIAQERVGRNPRHPQGCSTEALLSFRFAFCQEYAERNTRADLSRRRGRCLLQAAVVRACGLAFLAPVHPWAPGRKRFFAEHFSASGLPLEAEIVPHHEWPLDRARRACDAAALA